MVAILPAGGKGTRMSAVTGGRAKELLEVGGAPVIEWVLREAEEVKLDRVIAISSPDKTDLAKYVEGRAEVLCQVQANGHGAAVALPVVSDSVLVLNPDTIFFPRSPLVRIKESLDNGADIVLAVELVPEARVSSYGIVEWDGSDGRVDRILEKPLPSQTYSRWAIAGRFGLSPVAFAYVQAEVRGSVSGGEIGLTPILARAIDEGFIGQAIPLEPDEQRLDCGDPEGYAKAVALCRA